MIIIIGATGFIGHYTTKYFREMGIDVIATGSFLGVKGFRKPYERGIPVGYEEQLTMYPLSFHGR